jgi:3-phenylpropionate/trans-cinnamate dioxygenase ferredoxin reductase subunit
MGKIFRVSINGDEFFARRGENLLDAALMNGIDIPYDCRSGYCGACRVRVLEGRVLGGRNGDPESAHACECQVIEDVHLSVEEVPEIATTAGGVVGIRHLAPDVVEVAVELAHPLVYWPGQYVHLRFRGFPWRCYSPTVPLDRPGDNRTIRFHIRRVPAGHVSSALGHTIRSGHRLKLIGPFGSGYLRPGQLNRLVLVASGTGFAPIWSIAIAALREDPQRKIAVVVGAKTIKSLYMVPALCRLARFLHVTIIPCTDVPQSINKVVRPGPPTNHLPPLSRGDVIHACGAPAVVRAAAKMAGAAGARCYANPFVPNEHSDDGLLSRAMTWLKTEPEVLRDPPHPPAEAPRGSGRPPLPSEMPRRAGRPPRPGEKSPRPRASTTARY